MVKKLLPYRTKGIIEAGCDEAGRGCLAGPVVAAAVILPPRFSHPLLNDSKQLTHAQRAELRPIIEQKALAYAVTFIDEREIETINILNASLMAMERSALRLGIRPDELLIDGNRTLKTSEFVSHAIIKGDGIYRSIAAASILAKTYRDEYMENLHHEFPHFGWAENKGYPTITHRTAIATHGSTVHHRQTFNLLGEFQLEMEFD
jgi:ribonuclease HII